MANRTKFPVLFISALFLFFSCKNEKPSPENSSLTPSASVTNRPSGTVGDAKSNRQMLDLIKKTQDLINRPANVFASGERVRFYDSLLTVTKDPSERANITYRKGKALLEFGDEKGSIETFKQLFPLIQYMDDGNRHNFLMGMSVACLRFGERSNCINVHSHESCIMPIRGTGIHADKAGSMKAVEGFTEVLNQFPDDLDARWLINIAYMTLGQYPGGVPKKWLIPGLDAPSETPVKPFTDMSEDLGLGVTTRAGGIIADDFTGDGYLDIVLSAWDLGEDHMHFFKNNADGTFSDLSKQSGLGDFTGGLNMVSADYNNDGNLDIFVLRGAWQGQKGYGIQPNSLLRNNGDGTFTDVTIPAGIHSMHPTQTATWNDFNRDGHLDIFIGNESNPGDEHACEFYLNKGDGTFENLSDKIGPKIFQFVKGTTSGDYDHDGWPDIFVSAMSNTRILLRNTTKTPGAMPTFEDATQKAGLGSAQGFQTFGTFFFDYDNDGWLDIFAANYEFERPLSYYAARHALTKNPDMDGKVYLWKNNGNGTFSEVTRQMNLDVICFAMGNNFGDFDNDGWLDIYLATGNPQYESLLPNRLFKNMGGKKFADVTNDARVGHLQKGHGVSFVDLDNNGDQDIFAKMGGAFRGDAYSNAFYLNPGQNNNNWICITLEGTSTNRLATGTRVEVKFTENGKQRSVFRDVNTGGSFGCSPLRREIGIGTASKIDEIIITWPISGQKQAVQNVQPNQFIKIVEGKPGFEKTAVKTVKFRKKDGQLPMCRPGI